MATWRWQFYTTSDSGRSPVQKEFEKAKLARDEVAKIETMMTRVAEGRARPEEVKNLRDGVLEIRIRVDRRVFRLLYAEEAGALTLLALTLFQKQKQVEDKHFDRAVARLRDWRRRHGG